MAKAYPLSSRTSWKPTPDIKADGASSKRVLRLSGTKGLASTFSIFCWSSASDLLTRHTETCLAAAQASMSWKHVENRVLVHEKLLAQSSCWMYQH